jgi:hypothetical protein
MPAELWEGQATTIMPKGDLAGSGVLKFQKDGVAPSKTECPVRRSPEATFPYEWDDDFRRAADAVH